LHYSSLNSLFVAIAHSTLYRRLAIALLSIVPALLQVLLVDATYQPARADADVVVIDMPVTGPVVSNRMLVETERLVADALNRQFSQDLSSSTVQVTVLGSRNGEVIPVMRTTVSREQWQAHPQVSTWTRYYSSYALFQRHDDVQRVALVPARPGGSGGIDDLTPVAQLDQAYDSGNLSGDQAQRRLSDLD